MERKTKATFKVKKKPIKAINCSVEIDESSNFCIIIGCDWVY